MFAKLVSLYPAMEGLKQQMIDVADRMGEAIVKLSDDTGIPDFDHTDFCYERMSPFDNHRWKEPATAGAYAWFQYMTCAQTGDVKYLNAANLCMQFLERYEGNPTYEPMEDYAVYIATRMNAEQGRHFDIHKMINWLFETVSA